MPYLNRCIWSATSTGTGSFVVSAAAQNGYTPSNCLDPTVITGATYHYFAVDPATGNHEEGDGVYTSSTSTLTRATIRNSSNSGSIVNFTNAPIVYMGSPTSNDLLTLATANMTWYVATTGSDTNPGTSGSPFLTIAHAISVASSYNWNDAYYPTISIANGSYTGVQLTLPALFNCPNGGVIVGNNTTATSVTIADSGTSWTFTVAPYAQWTTSGFSFAGTYGGFNTVYGGILIVPSSGKVNFGGSLAQGGINVDSGGYLFAVGASLSTSASTIGTLIFNRGFFNFDTSNLTFTNAISITGSVYQGDATSSFGAFYGSTFTNGSNVTTSATCLVLTNGAFFETSSGTLVDGSALKRSNFPGYAAGVNVDSFSIFQGDGPFAQFYNLNDESFSSLAVGFGNLSGQSTSFAYYGNTAIGAYVMQAAMTTAAQSNCGFGSYALQVISSGANNTGVGVGSGNGITSGGGNTAVGQNTWNSNAGGSNNTAIGQGAGSSVTSGSNNTLIGKWTGVATLNSVVALSDGSGNIRADYGYTVSTSWTFQPIDIVAGTATVPPLKLTSGTNLTTAAAGAVEFDGTAFYATSVASSRQVVATEQFQNLSGTRTLTSNTSAQAIFNATTNGAITLAASTTYEFDMMVAVSGLSSSAHTVSLGFGGTATLTSIGYFYDAQAGSTLAGPTAALTGFVASASATAVIASSTTTGLVLLARGTIRVNAAGTLIPQLTQGTASAAAVVQANSFIRLWPVGSNTVTNVGDWS